MEACRFEPALVQAVEGGADKLVPVLRQSAKLRDCGTASANTPSEESPQPSANLTG